MKTEELKNLSREELQEKEKSLYAELSKLNLQRYTGNVEKPHKFALIKKDIARIKTFLNPVRNGALRRGISNELKQKKDK